MIAEPEFYLASSSPRRHALLNSLGLQFETLRIDIGETSEPGEKPADFAGRMAREKASRAVALVEAETDLRVLPVLAADTCVVVGGRILGKPLNLDHARSMLRDLSGRTHEVITSVALRDGVSLWQKSNRSRVTFDEITPRELEAYCRSGEPSDKAGAYAIQGLGAAFVKRIEGSYTGVVGLPLYETRCLLRKIGVDWL